MQVFLARCSSNSQPFLVVLIYVFLEQGETKRKRTSKVTVATTYFGPHFSFLG
jgi:hypothetical protein